MNWGYLLAVSLFFGFLLIIAQRVQASRRRIMRGFIVSMALLLMIRYEWQLENIIGYFVALFLSFTFWLLIGRYNPVGEGENITVYGMDD